MGRHFLFSCSAVALVLLASVATGQAPAGYHAGAPVAIPDSLVEVMAGGRFRATVVRTARTQRERDLIAAAERLYPSAEMVLGSARDAKQRDALAAESSGVSTHAYAVVPRSAGSPADRWWYDDFDATWTPFALTGAAVDYYLGRLRDIAAGRGQFRYGPGDTPDNGTFEYRASVRRGKERGTAFTVEMRLTWNYSCGMMCAMWFTHVRSVDFDAKGNVLRVRGDGRPQVTVS